MEAITGGSPDPQNAEKKRQDTLGAYILGRTKSRLPFSVAGIQALHAEWVTEEVALRLGVSHASITRGALEDSITTRMPELLRFNDQVALDTVEALIVGFSHDICDEELAPDLLMLPPSPAALLEFVDHWVYPFLLGLDTREIHIPGLNEYLRRQMSRSKMGIEARVDDRGITTIETDPLKIWEDQNPYIYRVEGGPRYYNLLVLDGNTKEILQQLPVTSSMLLAMWHLTDAYLARRETEVTPNRGY